MKMHDAKTASRRNAASSDDGLLHVRDIHRNHGGNPTLREVVVSVKAGVRVAITGSLTRYRSFREIGRVREIGGFGTA